MLLKRCARSAIISAGNGKIFGSLLGLSFPTIGFRIYASRKAHHITSGSESHRVLYVVEGVIDKLTINGMVWIYEMNLISVFSAGSDKYVSCLSCLTGCNQGKGR